MKVLETRPLKPAMAAMAQPSHTHELPEPVVLPARLIQDGEEVILALKPGGFFILLASGPFILAVFVLGVAAYSLDSFNIIQLPLHSVALLCVASALVRILLSCLQWLSRVYVLTNHRIIRVKGVLRISIFECPLSRIQNTVLSLSFGERVFGLGTVLFATAGTGRMEAGWVMIAKPTEVHEIVIEYVRRTQSRIGPT